MGNLKHSPKSQKTSNSLLVFFVRFTKDVLNFPDNFVDAGSFKVAQSLFETDDTKNGLFPNPDSFHGHEKSYTYTTKFSGPQYLEFKLLW